jgi:hypothetical protein
MHCSSPVAFANVPTAHAGQLVCLVAAVAVPTLHAVHAVCAGMFEYDPAAQSMQSVALVAFE